jgi:hypothetical protein
MMVGEERLRPEQNRHAEAFGEPAMNRDDPLAAVTSSVPSRPAPCRMTLGKARQSAQKPPAAPVILRPCTLQPVHKPV